MIVRSMRMLRVEEVISRFGVLKTKTTRIENIPWQKMSSKCEALSSKDLIIYVLYDLKGLSHETDLAFDDKYGYF
jgi:hypothetical protein